MQHSPLLFISAFRFAQNSASGASLRGTMLEEQLFSPPFPFSIDGFSLLSLLYENLYLCKKKKKKRKEKKEKRETHTDLRPRHDLVKTRCVIMEKINRDRNRFGYRKLAPWLNRPRTGACERAHFHAYRLPHGPISTVHPPNIQFSYILSSAFSHQSFQPFYCTSLVNSKCRSYT